MNAYNPGAWVSFFAAEAGAAAALTGLVIVAISINLGLLIKDKALSSRAAETVTMLAGALVFSTFGVVPGQPNWLLGSELLATGLTVCIGTAVISRGAGRHPEEPPWLREIITYGATIPVMGAGFSLAAGVGGGLYWLVPGIVMALVGGVLNTWVLLVEVLR